MECLIRLAVYLFIWHNVGCTSVVHLNHVGINSGRPHGKRNELKTGTTLHKDELQIKLNRQNFVLISDFRSVNYRNCVQKLFIIFIENLEPG